MQSLMRWVRVFAQHLPMRRSLGGESATLRAPLLDTLEPEDDFDLKARLPRRDYSDKMMRPERDYADK